VSSGDVAIQLLNWPRPSGLQEYVLEHDREHGDAGPVHPGDERVPPPGRDATLLAVVPIPGTGMSLAVVGYAIATSPASPHRRPAAPGQKAPGQKAPGQKAPGQKAPGQKPGSGLQLDHGQRRVWTDGCEIQLTFREFQLLAFLSAHPATVFTRADLVEQVWRRDPAPDGRDSQDVARDSRTVDVHVSRVRRKLGPRYGQCLVTEYRVGYQFRPLSA
jgi:Transcriptional regulatory protein, C terminal